MPPRGLYQRLCQHLQRCAPDYGAWQRQRLALVVTGLVLARHTALTRMAAPLRQVIGTASADSIERRLRRALADPHLDSAVVFEHLVRASLRSLPVGRCVLLLDDTQQTDQCTVSTLALAYGGRALPLAWCRWSGPLHGAYWTQIGEVFDQAQRVLPPQVQPVVLADRGLASAVLVELVRQHGWDFLLRVQRQTTIRASLSTPRVHLGELVSEPGAASVTVDGWVFYDHPTWVHAAAVWRQGHQAAWLLISNLDLGQGLADLYARRMQVEALFRDAKSGGFEWELSRVVRGAAGRGVDPSR